MTINTYTSLHVHSEYSTALLGFTDSMIHISEAVHWCYDNGLRGMSLSDHEGCSGYVELEQTINNMNLERPFQHIFANEIYLLSQAEDELHLTNDKRPTYWHFLLNALDLEGVHQIYELSARAWLRSYVYKGLRRRPTYYSDIEEVIGQNTGHIVGSTACLGGVLPKLILNNELDRAKGFIQWGIKTFGKGNFFLECQPCDDDNAEQITVNNTLWQLHEELDVPIIVTTDAHYLEAKDRNIHKVYLQSKDGGDTREVDAFYATAHLFAPDELRKTLYNCFNDEQIDTMFKTTNDIADRVQPITLKQTTQVPSLPTLPEFNIQHFYKDYYNQFEYLNYYAHSNDKWEQFYFFQIEKGLREYQDTHNINVLEYLTQIDLEMEQVKKLGDIFDHQRMSDYFTVVQKVVDLIWTEGDSIVGIGRGSCGCYVTDRLLGITGVDPLLPELKDFYPWWRFCSTARSDSIFDIDIDIQSFNKERIIQAIKNYFGERKVCQVVTWGKLSARTAIERACRGLGISNDNAGYLRSLVPVKRGAVYSLKDCLYGNPDKNREKVHGFKAELDKFPGVLDAALAFEGLIISSGVHAGALNILKTDFTNTGSLMVSSNGAVINQFDLHHAEYQGQLKFDLLSIDALVTIRECLELLAKNNKIQWQGSLRATYDYYLGYDVLEQTNKSMWDLLPTMLNAFQYDSIAGKNALHTIGAHNLTELTLANGLMRLTSPDGEQPMERYVRYKNDINEWYQDMTAYGIDESEQQIFKRLLGKYSGMLIAQEQMMIILMDKEVCNFTLKESDKARKAVAKQDRKSLLETEERLYRKGKDCGRSKIFLDYLWNVQIEMSKSYAFSFCHANEYSIECLQELNMYYHYPQVYWNTAVITTQSQVGDDRENSATAINYGKIVQSIYKGRANGITVNPPSINTSDISFTPNESDNTILFGLGGISGINVDIAKEVIDKRPFTSFKNFYESVSKDENTLVKHSKIIKLIKAGCFDEFGDRVDIMNEYIKYKFIPKTTLTTSNLQQCINLGVDLPKDLVRVYNFKRYVLSKQFFYCKDPNFKSKKHYIVEEKFAKPYLTEHYLDDLKEGKDYYYENDQMVIIDKSLERVLKPDLEKLKAALNDPKVIESYNHLAFEQLYKDSVKDDIRHPNVNAWSFDATSYYHYDAHELENIDYKEFNLSHFNELPEQPRFIERHYGKRSWRQYDISKICGTVVDRDDNKHIVYLLTPDNNVVSVKFNGGQYSWYKQTISEVNSDGTKTILDPSWFARGTLLMVVGYRNEDNFRAKRYKNTIFQHTVVKILDVNTYELQTERIGEDEEIYN